MSEEASKFQEKTMSRIYRGKEIFKPLNTGVLMSAFGRFFNHAVSAQSV